MLRAKSKHGKLTTLAMLSRTEINLLRQENFYCPTCGQRVMVKAGPRTIPHFAHYQQTVCASFENGEGTYHEQGKLLLYNWLKRQQFQVELEVFIPTINQRPDLLLTLKNKQIAIEFQCARIPIRELHKRNAGYRAIGITPIWILGANQFNRVDTNKFKINQFTLQFIHQFNASFPPSLYYFCPNTKRFINVQDIYIATNGHALGKFRICPLETFRFLDLFVQHMFTKTEMNHLWKREKHRFRMRQRNRLYGNELAWHQWLYLRQNHLETLPSCIYLPVSDQMLMKTPLWNWQSRLCLDIIEPLPIGGIFSIKTCVYFLRKHLHSPRDFPLLQPAQSPIKAYLQWLIELNIIEQINTHQYRKRQALTFYRHIEAALTGDEQIMQRITTMHQNKK